MGRNAPDLVNLGKVLSSEKANSLPVGSVIEMAASAAVVDKYVLAEGGYLKKADWPALADALANNGFRADTFFKFGMAVPFVNIINVKVCGDLFVMLCKKGIYTSPDGLTWTPRFMVDFNSTFQIERLSDGSLIIFGSNGLVAVTVDGVNWTTLSTSFATTINYVDKIGTTYFFASGSSLYSTTNFVTATVIPWGNGAVTGLYCGTKLCVCAATSYYLSADGGSTWSSGLVITSSYHVGRKSDGKIIRAGNSGTPGILYSADNGETWSSVTAANNLMTAPADFVSLSSKGNIVAGTPAQTKSCLAFNASSDPNSVYTEMVLDAVYASYFKLLLSGLYQRIETNSKFILFFGVGSAQPCFRAIAIPSGVIAQPTGKTLFPFVFSANGYLGTNTISQGFSLTSRKISDGLFIHSCCLCGLTAWMSSGNYYLYHTVFFSYTEDKNTGTLTFYNMSTYSADLTLSSGNFSVKIQNAYVRAGTLYIYFSYTNNTDSFIKVIQWALDGTGQPTESTVDVMASVANAWYTVNSIGDKIVYQRTIGGNYISIDKNGTVISFGLLATSDINTFLFSIGEDSFIYNVWYTSSGNQNVVKISYDGGATFQRIFSGGATTLLAFSGAVTFFNGYYWGVPYSGSLLYRARKFSDLTSGAVPSVFANVPTGQMEVIADGNLLAIFSSAGMTIIDKFDNILTFNVPVAAQYCIPPMFFNGDYFAPTWSTTANTPNPGATGTVLPDDCFSLPSLPPSATGLHKYIKGE